MIRKTNKGWKVINHKTGKSFGTYPSKAKAKMRLKQIKTFRSKNDD